MNRNHNQFLLFAVMVMLTFALTNLQAQSSVTNSAPPIPATNTNAPTRPISDAQFKKILADNETNGKTAPIPVILATAFGVNHPGAMERADGFNDTNNTAGNIHVFAKLDNGNYMFTMHGKTIVYNYYVDKNLALISALSLNAKNEITVLSNKDAQTGLNTEFAFFADIANQL